MEQTREAIFQATAEQLADHGISEFNVPLIAERAGVSVRTIYRYFPTREALLDAFAVWLDGQVGPSSPNAVADIDQLPEAIKEIFRDFESNEAMVRSQWATPHGRSIRERGRLRRKAAYAAAVRGITRHLGKAEQNAATAVIAYLSSSRTWQAMKDEHGMNGEESGEAVAWAVRALIADLRKRDAAAAKTRLKKS